MHMQSSGTTSEELVPLLSFLSSGDEAQIIRFAGQAFYLLSCFTRPQIETSIEPFPH